jgi:hypothetical protein
MKLIPLNRNGYDDPNKSQNACKSCERIANFVGGRIQEPSPIRSALQNFRRQQNAVVLPCHRNETQEDN